MAQEAPDNEAKSTDNESDYVTSFPKDPLLDRAYGVCIGAAIGDSLGSFCEFRKTGISKEEVDTAMTMPGGGTWGKKVITGQVTDDTELAVSLAYGLIDCIGKLPDTTRIKPDQDTDDEKDKPKVYPDMFDLTKIAPEYRRWVDSHPFDIGFCTRSTLSQGPNVKKMKQTAFDYNAQKTKTKGVSKSSIFKGNMANGATMRCMPLCLYGYKLKPKNLYKLMKEDASLSHAHLCVYLVNTCYAIMIQYLLNAKPENNKRNIEAFSAMITYLTSETKIRKRGRYETTPSEQEKQDEELKCAAAKEILEQWLENIDVGLVDVLNDAEIKDKKGDKEIIAQLELHPATIHQGFVKIAFQRCCYHLLKGNSFEDAMRSVVSEGGDTDTNACIVGGLMGAYRGLKGIPKQYVLNIHKCQPQYDKTRDIFQAKWYFKDKVCELLIKNAPTDADICILQDY
eukprot:243658_1